LNEACIPKVSFLGNFSGIFLGRRPGRLMQDLSKLRRTQPSLVELGLGLSFAKMKKNVSETDNLSTEESILI
jgi:hypothetical protein